MAGLVDILGSVLGQDSIGTIANQLGTDPETAGKAVSAALPTLLGRMAQNASSEPGAAALASAVNKDHDGGLLDDLGAFLGGGHASAPGGKILGHVFGADQEASAQHVAQQSGLGVDKAGNLLAMLAPMVMGALGRVGSSTGGLQAGGLGALLAGAAKSLGAGNGGGGHASGGGAAGGAAGPAGMVGKVTNMLDKNKDGSVADDVQRLAKSGPAKKLLGMFRRKR